MVYFKMNNIKSDESGTDFDMEYYVYDDIWYNDRIAPGAIKLNEPKRLPLLWNYEENSPIGVCTITDAGDHMHIIGHIDHTVPRGKDIAALLTAGKPLPLADIGFGYDVKADEWDGRKRTIKEMKLWNISLFAAHDESSVEKR